MKKNSPSTAITFRELADWQKLVTQPLSDEETRRLLQQKDFWSIPKHNEQIARQHAMLVDKILGLDLQSVEEGLVRQGRAKLPAGSFEYWGPALHQGSQTWVGLDAQTLNTPYAVLWRLCELLELKHERVVDLGAAEGRLGVVLQFFAPKAHFLGLEYVPERVAAAQRMYQRWQCTQAGCEVQDLFAADFALPEVDVYFIYDYGRHDHINATLGQIRAEAEKRSIRLVARGQATNKLIDDHHAWAKPIYQGVHEERFTIYQGAPEDGQLW